MTVSLPPPLLSDWSISIKTSAPPQTPTGKCVILVPSLLFLPPFLTSLSRFSYFLPIVLPPFFPTSHFFIPFFPYPFLTLFLFSFKPPFHPSFISFLPSCLTFVVFLGLVRLCWCLDKTLGWTDHCFKEIGDYSGNQITFCINLITCISNQITPCRRLLLNVHVCVVFPWCTGLSMIRLRPALWPSASSDTWSKYIIACQHHMTSAHSLTSEQQVVRCVLLLVHYCNLAYDWLE